MMLRVKDTITSYWVDFSGLESSIRSGIVKPLWMRRSNQGKAHLLGESEVHINIIIHLGDSIIRTVYTKPPWLPGVYGLLCLSHVIDQQAPNSGCRRETGLAGLRAPGIKSRNKKYHYYASLFHLIE